MRMSQRPKRLSTSFAMVATDSGEETSQLQASASRPACSTSFTVASPGATSAIATCAPSSASRLANAWPMPFAPPVMTATLSRCPLPIRVPMLRARISARHPGYHPERLVRHGLARPWAGCYSPRNTTSKAVARPRSGRTPWWTKHCHAENSCSEPALPAQASRWPAPSRRRPRPRPARRAAAGRPRGTRNLADAVGDRGRVHVGNGRHHHPGRRALALRHRLRRRHLHRPPARRRLRGGRQNVSHPARSSAASRSRATSSR